MKKHLFILLLTTVATISAWAQSGTCGTNLRWTLNTSTGVLTITGSGTMTNFSFEAAPWYYERSSIKSVNLPNGLTTIGNYAFMECSKLTSVTIPNSVTSIGNDAFFGCSGLTSMTIPTSVTAIGSYAFAGCTGLTSVTIPNSVTSISDGAFSNINNIVYSGTAIGSPWRAKCVNGYIDGYLVYKDATKTKLYGCSSAVKGEITIPDGVTSIGNSAFYCCSGLTTITIPNSVTSIGSGAFYQCSGLTKTNYIGTITDWCGITLGSNPISYSHNFYINDVEIKDLVISNSVTLIGSNTFSGCSGLTSVTIPNSVTSIGNAAFSGCIGLTSITIPNSVTSIGNSAFSGCIGLTSISIGNSVTSIGDNAFSNCTGLTSTTIPNSVKSIGGYAFFDCSGLTSVTIPNSVTSIGDGAFSNINNIVYSGTAIGSPWGAKCVNGYIDGYLVYEDVTKTKLCGCSSAAQGEITIPNSVTSIGDYAFSNCTGLTSITIQHTVTSIGINAFYNVLNIAYYGTATGSPWGAKCVNGYVDGYFVFADPTKTRLCFCSSAAQGEITIPNSVTSIGDNAFSNCTGLTSITIPNSVTSIGDYAFNGCTGLKAITIPNSVTSIGNYALASCSALTSITIPNSVTSIKSFTFSGCNSLTSVTIPNSVTSIGIFAFQSCSSLSSISIPNSVTSVGRSAFSGCTGLTLITCEAATPPSLGNEVFNYVSKTIPVYVPAGSVNAYYNWGGFKNIQPISAGSADVTTNTASDITENSVAISWPQVAGADQYVIEIRFNSVLVCTITFNSQGQLISIALAAPSLLRDRENSAAQALSNGWKYTVSGLDADKTYDYSVIAKNSGGTTIDTKTGTFKTLPLSGLEEILSAPNANSKKILIDGQIYILHNGKAYDLTGKILQ